jgi:biotin operon repressor
MYEHSYHIDFGAKPAAYVDAFMGAIRWNNSDRLFSELTKDGATQPGHRPTWEVGMRVLICLLTAVAVLASARADAQEIDWQKVDTALGRKPAVSGDVHRYGFPRTDLSVTLDGVTIKPALALGGWVAFKPAHGGAMIMGDLVLLETEINPVMAKLIEAGLDVTAVHNHLLRANPATFYMHVGGHGDPAKIASAIHDALSASKTPLSPPAASAPPPAIDLDTAHLDAVIGVKGQSNGGVYQFGVPRRSQVTENGMPMTPAAPLGLATAINFQPSGNGKAAITGDFVLTGDEVNPVIRALRSNGIEVTAVHSHMLDDQPRLFFLHFWANDDAEKLARGLRAAIDKTASLSPNTTGKN